MKSRPVYLKNPTLKYTKIFIPEIPVDWTNRTRSGHTNIWNQDTKDPANFPEVSLEPPKQGLYAERYKDGWYWVCGCAKCFGNDDKDSYIVCYEHDRCITCNTHRDDLVRAPWSRCSGFECSPCAEQKHEQRKAEALAQAEEQSHSEVDCWNETHIVCPHCASVNEREELYEQGSHKLTCDVCDKPFNVEIEYEIRYTSTKIQNESGNNS